MPPSKTPAANNENMLKDHIFSKMSESIQLVFDLTSRIDERLKMQAEKQSELEEKLARMTDIQQVLMQRLTTLEAKDVSQNEIDDLNERVAVLQSDDPEMKKDLDKIKDELQTLKLKLENLSLRAAQSDNNWLKIFDGAWKIILMCIAGYILYKLGIQPPP